MVQIKTRCLPVKIKNIVSKAYSFNCCLLFDNVFILGHPLFFLRLLSNAFPDIGSVGRIEKKKPERKSQEVSE